MKNKVLFTAILASTILLFSGSLEAQRLHKHFKRVRVEPGQSKTETTIGSPVSSPVVSPEKPMMEPVSETERMWYEVVVAAADEETEATVSSERKKEKVFARDLIRQSTTMMTSFSSMENLKTARSFIANLKHERDQLRAGPQDPQKTMLARWLTVMIILYAVGFLFLILGIVFSFTVPYPVAVVCYILFGLCWIAATIVLILGLVGVMA